MVAHPPEAFNLDFQLQYLVAKIEAGEIQPEIMQVDVNNLLESVIEHLSMSTQEELKG